MLTYERKMQNKQFKKALDQHYDEIKNHRHQLSVVTAAGY